MTLVRHESRLIRPFLYADELRNIFSSSAIRLKPGDEPSVHESQIVKPEDAEMLAPTILPLMDRAMAVDLLQKLELGIEGIRIAVIVTSNEMRLSEVIASYGFDDLPDDEIELLPKARRFLLAKGGCDISLAMVLGKECDVKALKPFTLGQWLAKKTFNLRAEKPSNSFRILPLNEKDRLRLRLPEGLVYFVEEGGTLNEPEAKLEDCVTVWVVEPIFNALSRDPASRISSAFQKMMLTEIASSVVLSEVRSLDGAMPEAGSPLDGFFTDLARDSKVSKEQLVQYARPNGDPYRLGAYIQQMLDVRGAIRSSF